MTIYNLPSRRKAVAVGLAASTSLACSRLNNRHDVACEGKSDIVATAPNHQGQQSEQRIPSPSAVRKALAATVWYPLPIPRRLMKNDPVFRDGKLRAGLRQRQKDEARMRSLVLEIQEAKGDRSKVETLFHKMTEIAYGKGVTPQEREDFLVKYGCTGWTPEVLDALSEVGASRGFVEVGAGHGQWARALTDHYLSRKHERESTLPDNYDFVLAYDDESNLPLDRKIYHDHTQPAHDYFFQKVERMSSNGGDVIFRKWSTRGRVLLLVFPPPGAMALNTLKTYISASVDNDTLVYVGEGRGGANGNEAFFDFLEEDSWVLHKVMNVRTQPGDKGFEKLFILKRQTH